MQLFLGLIKSDNEIYYRLLDTSDDTIITRDIPAETLRRQLTTGAIKVRNLGLDNNYCIVGTCGKIQNYSIIDCDTGKKKLAYVIMMRRNDKYLVADIDGKTRWMNNLEVIVLSQTAPLANAKLVNRNGNTYIAAISGTFDTGRSEADKMSERINKFALMDEQGKLSKGMSKQLKKAEQEFEAREDAIRDAQSKRLLGVSDRVFMEPINAPLRRLEYTKEQSKINRALNRINKLQSSINGSLRVMMKKRMHSPARLASLCARRDAYVSDVKEVMQLDLDRVPIAEIALTLGRLEERGNILYQDIVDYYSEGVLTSNEY